MKKVNKIIFFFNYHLNDNFLIPGQLYGLEKFWAFIKYYKNSTKLVVEPKLDEFLLKFKTIEDFRVDEPQINEMLQGVGSLRTSQSKRRHRSFSETEGYVANKTNIRRSGAGGQNSGNQNQNVNYSHRR